MQDLCSQLEQFIIKTKQYISTTIAEMLEQKLPELTSEKFALFQSTGNRLIYEQAYFGKRKFLTLYGVAAMWMKQEGLDRLGNLSRETILGKLEEVLYSVCAEECWALPAHVNMEDLNWSQTIDLFAAETANTLADIVDGVGADLSSQCVAQVWENVRSRVLRPFYESPEGTYGWEHCDNNWNAVCNGNLGSAYLHSLAEGEVPNPQYLERNYSNLLHYMEGLAEDGTCMEGLGYYFYGMTYLVYYAQLLYEKTKGTMDLLRGDWGEFQADGEDKRARVATWFSKCFFTSGRTVSFSDGDSREKYRMGVACALAECFETVCLPDTKCAMSLEEDHCFRYIPFKMDLFCTMRYLKHLQREVQGKTDQNSQGEQKQSGITSLPYAQWCIGEASLQQVGFACKGGHNDEPHNHNDVGSFLYVAEGELFLTDLGAGEYTKGYFGEGRYQILCNRSLGHSVPLIAGQEQLTGAVCKCDSFLVEETSGVARIVMELASAYGEERLKVFTRTLCFDKETGALTVEDFFKSEEEITITENLVTQFLPEIEGNSILLRGKKVCHIRILSRRKEDREMPNVLTMEHYNHQGQKEKVFLIQWQRTVKNKHQERFRIEMI